MPICKRGAVRWGRRPRKYWEREQWLIGQQRQMWWHILKISTNLGRSLVGTTSDFLPRNDPLCIMACPSTHYTCGGSSSSGTWEMSKQAPFLWFSVGYHPFGLFSWILGLFVKDVACFLLRFPLPYSSSGTTHTFPLLPAFHTPFPIFHQLSQAHSSSWTLPQLYHP